MMEVFDAIFGFCLTVGFYLFVFLVPAWLVFKAWSSNRDGTSEEEDMQYLIEKIVGLFGGKKKKL